MVEYEKPTEGGDGDRSKWKRLMGKTREMYSTIWGDRDEMEERGER